MSNALLVFAAKRALGHGKRFKTAWMEGGKKITLTIARVRPKKRGRKAKVAVKAPVVRAAPKAASLTKTGKRRGRPPKVKPVEVVAEPGVIVEAPLPELES